MSRTSWINAGALALAIAGSILATTPRSVAVEAPVAATPTEAGGGARRIASASTVADALLRELCPPGRIVAVTALSAEGRDAYRLEGVPTVRSLDDVEAIVGLRPDVVLAHNVADPGRVERLRRAGVRVEDLGALEGRASLGEDARVIGALCGAPDAGRRWAEAFERRMDAVAADVPADARRRGLYLTVYGDRFMGGTVGSSYHDVMSAGGVIDAAATSYHGWPTYDVEQLLELDPDVIISREGMRPTLCGHPVLRRLRACPSDVIELDPDLLDDPGPGMLEAAEAVRAAVYPGVSADGSTGSRSARPPRATP
ncbi:MAG: ABC transporter substrate-binding protein [Sandaracinaceae bacterium]|nr:ABC transporter substrate-binding protein [Sandaracinaceae bacterium]